MPFHITDWNVGTKTLTKSKDGLCMVVVMKRKITSEMMADFLWKWVDRGTCLAIISLVIFLFITTTMQSPSLLKF